MSNKTNVLPQPNIARLLGKIAELGKIGALVGGGVCRLALTDEDRAGRDLVVAWMRELGLDLHIDGIGNVVGCRAGVENCPPVMIGSHIDTVRTGGLYDGTLGVLAGLEIIAALNDAGVTTKKPLAVAFFTNEEGSRFQPDMMGSLVYQGGMSLEEALETIGIDGSSVGENLARIGYKGQATTGQNELSAYIELHIEQGPVLEHEHITIGAVSGVQGIHWLEFSIDGVSNHAGTTPMKLRHDAGLVACDIVAAARRLALEIGDGQLATTGSFTLSPNLVNVIPERATFTLDLRNTDNEKLKHMVRLCLDHAYAAARREGVRLSHRVLADFAPVAFHEDVIKRVENCAMARGYSVKRLPSGAGHDAQMLAKLCPAGMIFVPSVNGLSHNIKEYTHDHDIEAGLNVLFDVVLQLSEQQ